MKSETQTFETFGDLPITGYVVKRGYELPKSAKLQKHLYDAKFENSIAVYKTINKTFLLFSKL